MSEPMPRPDRERSRRLVPGVPSETSEQVWANAVQARAEAAARLHAQAVATLEHGTTVAMAARCRKLNGQPCEDCRLAANAIRRQQRAAARPAYRSVRPRSTR